MVLLIHCSYFRYVKEYAIRYGAKFVSMDDKCKVNIGEPGHPVAAVARGKQVSHGWLSA